MQPAANTEAKLLWHCGMLDAQTARVEVQWNGCEAGTAEAETWITAFMKALGWVADPGKLGFGDWEVWDVEDVVVG